MKRREFIAAGVGGGTVLLVGADSLLGDDGSRIGSDLGPVSTPASSGSRTLDNGLRASLHAGGAIAFFGASLVHDSSGRVSVAGRLKNVSGTTLHVSVKVQFLDDAGEVIVQGWVAEDDLPDGKTWAFTAYYPRNDRDRIAGANIPAITTS